MAAPSRRIRWRCFLFGHIWQTWSSAEKPFRYCVGGDAMELLKPEVTT